MGLGKDGNAPGWTSSVQPEAYNVCTRQPRHEFHDDVRDGRPFLSEPVRRLLPGVAGASAEVKEATEVGRPAEESLQRLHGSYALDTNALPFGKLWT